MICRFLSAAEVSTALRPFYFSVHPDLFGKYPEQRVSTYSARLHRGKYITSLKNVYVLNVVKPRLASKKIIMYVKYDFSENQ